MVAHRQSKRVIKNTITGLLASVIFNTSLTAVALDGFEG